jgi:hypothetical protein
MKRIILFGLAVASLAGVSRAAADVVVMEDGRRIRGELVSVNRGLVLFDEIRDGSAQKNRLRLNKDEVSRIVLRDDARDPIDEVFGGGRGDERGEDRGDEDVLYRGGSRGARGEAAPLRPSSARTRTVTVAARQPWTDTGLEVAEGDILQFTSEGTIEWAPGREDGPAGEMNSPSDRRRPIPSRPGGALIGRIGASASDVFFIGSDRGSFRVRNGGRLYLGVNDGDAGDNSGSFQVRITR